MITCKIQDIFGEGSCIFYRVLVGSTIKYLQVPYLNMKAFGFDYYTQHNTENKERILGIDRVPDGDWNIGYLDHAGDDGKLAVVSTEKRELPDIVMDWNDVKVGYDGLEKLEDNACRPYLLQNIYPVEGRIMAGPPVLGVPVVLAYTSPLQWYGRHRNVLNAECAIHQAIQGKGIAPRFLGHLTENDTRLIGYLLEAVEARPASIEDLEACRTVLGKLHALGFSHGTIMRENFIILNDGSALLQAFRFSRQTSDLDVFAKEMEQVEMVLQAPWPKNTLWNDEPRKFLDQFQEKFREIHRRDFRVHPIVFWEAENEGKVTVTQDEHRVFLLDLKKNGGRWTKKDLEEALRRRSQNGGRWWPEGALQKELERLAEERQPTV